MTRGTIEDVSVLYRIPQSTLRRWVAEGRIRRYGKRPTIIDLDEVDAAIETRWPARPPTCTK